MDQPLIKRVKVTIIIFSCEEDAAVADVKP